ncbi:hypothetical protein PSHT_03489 [Puccinia striiformis]|uniref:Uncharacterized protein n=1 Tax=Puccinia striiformis TaxID=27350 RepID=A0A2S4WFJ7_9BASI|nr:hypothetical protein PSHT_03489 [Puccinia striiformis]
MAETIKEGAGQSDLIKQRGEKAFPRIPADIMSYVETMQEISSDFLECFGLLFPGIKEASQKRIWRKQTRYIQISIWTKEGYHKKFQSHCKSFGTSWQIYSIEEETQRLTSIMNQVKDIYFGCWIVRIFQNHITPMPMQDLKLEIYIGTISEHRPLDDYLQLFLGNFLQTLISLHCVSIKDLSMISKKYLSPTICKITSDVILNKNTLFHLSRINIAMRMLHVAASDDYISCDFFSLAREFILVTSIKSQELPSGIETNFNALASKIFNELLKFQEDKITIRLGKTMSAIEEAFGYFSTGLKLVYSKYVRTIQLEALGSFKQKYKPSILYLTQIYTKDEVSNYTPKMYERHNKNTSLIIAQTNLILKKLKNIEDSDRRSIKQLHEDKENLEEILNEPIDDYITREYMK